MSDRDTKLIRHARSARLSFPDAEAKQAWLPLLLEAYAIIDAGNNEAICREEKQDRTLACHKGSAAYCRSHTTILIYPLELIGINWYVVDKITGPLLDEDAYYTRRQDVLTPIRDYADAAFDVLLPFYGIKKSAERMQAFDARHAAEK